MKYVLSLDGGLATFGAVISRTDGIESICRHVEAFETEARERKWSFLMVDDITRRARELARWFQAFIAKWTPVAAFAERMPIFGVKNVYAQILNSVGWGVVVAELQRRMIPLTSVAPTTWRKAICGNKNEEKAHAAAMAQYPSYGTRELQVDADMRVHCRDALGVFAWAARGGLVRRAVSGG